MNKLKSVKAVKEEVKDVKNDIEDGIKSIKKDVKEGTESIKEDVKDAERAIKEDTEIIKGDVKDVKEFIKESVKILVTALGELHFVGLCFTLNVLMNPGSHGNRRRQSTMSS